MESNPYKNARLLLFISGVLYILGSLLLLVVSIMQRENIQINGAYLRELASHPVIFVIWILMIIVPIIIGIIALWYRGKKPEQMTKAVGVTFIVVGVLTFFTGIGVLLAVAGGQIIILQDKYAKGFRLNQEFEIK